MISIFWLKMPLKQFIQEEDRDKGKGETERDRQIYGKGGGRRQDRDKGKGETWRQRGTDRYMGRGGEKTGQRRGKWTDLETEQDRQLYSEVGEERQETERERQGKGTDLEIEKDRQTHREEGERD